MWHVTAEENIRCTECHHQITSGIECLSQMPEIMPEHFRRRNYKNFCIDCAECSGEGQPPCYVRRLDHWYAPTAQANEPIGCAYCGELIPKGTWAVAPKFYAWPAPESESRTTLPAGGGAETTARAAGFAVARASDRAYAGAWENLSNETVQRFKTGGLGRGLSSRSTAEGQRFYETSVPGAVRNQGESAVRNFVKGKHASHIKSVANEPGLAKRPDNVVWETAGKNFSRGNRDMTATGVAATKSAGRNAGIRATAKGAAKGGLVAAAIEAPVAGLENFFHWKRGRKSGGQAAKDTAKKTAGAGAAGVGATVAVAGAAKGAALMGISPTLGPAGVPLAIAGAGLMVGTTTYRLVKAAKRDLPLDGYHLFFCEDTDCKTRFAQDLTDAALGRDQWHTA